MSDQVNKEQTKAATQENITELTDEQLDEAAGARYAPPITFQPLPFTPLILPTRTWPPRIRPMRHQGERTKFICATPTQQAE